MKNTKDLIERYRDALVDTIQYLDRISHSDTHLRHKVDVVLNGQDTVKERSEKEIKQAEEVLERYEY